MWQPALTETGWTRSWIAAAQSPQTGMSLDEGMAESNSLAWKYLKYIRRKKVVSCFFPFSVLWTSSSSAVDQLSSFRVACTDPISSRNKLKYSKANRLIRNPQNCDLYATYQEKGRGLQQLVKRENFCPGVLKWFGDDSPTTKRFVTVRSLQFIQA